MFLTNHVRRQLQHTGWTSPTYLHASTLTLQLQHVGSIPTMTWHSDLPTPTHQVNTVNTPSPTCLPTRCDPTCRQFFVVCQLQQPVMLNPTPALSSCRQDSNGHQLASRAGSNMTTPTCEYPHQHAGLQQDKSSPTHQLQSANLPGRLHIPTLTLQLHDGGIPYTNHGIPP